MTGIAAVAAGLLVTAGLLGLAYGLRRTVPRPSTRPTRER